MDGRGLSSLFEMSKASRKSFSTSTKMKRAVRFGIRPTWPGHSFLRQIGATVLVVTVSDEILGSARLALGMDEVAA